MFSQINSYSELSAAASLSDISQKSQTIYLINTIFDGLFGSLPNNELDIR